jgi:ABC-type Mn2+/Zn2+ transport system permease subunit
MSEFWSALSHPFALRALLASLAVATLCSVMSFFVVLRRMAFLGAGIAHIAFAGVALALVLELPPILGAGVVALLAAAWIARVRRDHQLSEDTAIGIAFAAAMGFGVICASMGGARNADLLTYLFGNVLTVTGSDLIALGLLGSLVLAIIGYLFRDLLFVSFDEDMARIVRLPTDALNLLLLLLVAATVVLAIRTVGLLLVSAFLVIPGAVAQRTTRRLKPFFAVSCGVGIFSAVAGLALSFALDLPSGATMVLVASALFTLSVIFAPQRA